MAFIDATALNVVLPSLQQSLHASAADMFWVLNAYLLMLAALVLIGGSLGDLLGRKKVFMYGILIFIVGSALCGIAGGVTTLIIFRIIQGIGGALMIPGSLSLISASINEKERGDAISIWSAVTTMVTVGGPILGGALGDAGYWRFIFFINIPIGLMALIFLGLKVKEVLDETANQAIDYPGAVTIALGLAALTFGFLRMPAVGLHHWTIITSLLAGTFLLITFIVIESKSKHPMMPLGLFKDRTFSGTNLLTFFLYAGLRAGLLFLTLNLVQMQGYGQLQSGLTILPFTILMVSVGRFAGKLSNKFGVRTLLTIGPALSGVGLWLLSTVQQTNGPADYWTTFFPGVVIFGLGMSLTVSPLTSTVMSSAGHHSGTASGVNNAISSIATVFSNAIFGALAVLFFMGFLQKELKHINVPQKQSILKAAVDFGNAKAPAGLNQAESKQVTKLFHESFISAYGKVLRISAGLAFLSALIAVVSVRRKPSV
jgi:EmrB/QacA subfamily drug resistance transporter